MAWWNGPQARAQGPDFQRSHLPASIRRRIAHTGREVSHGLRADGVEPAADAAARQAEKTSRVGNAAPPFRQSQR